MPITKLNNFVSEEDKFLKQFDKNHPELTLSQQVEIEKHKRIAKLRDEKEITAEERKIWEGF